MPLNVLNFPPPPTAGYFIDGTSGDDTLYGSSLGDDIYGRDGSDTLYGQGGNDNLYGGNGSDTLVGGTGADHLDGGDGIDTASYAGSATAVTVDLANGSGFGGDAEGDTYISIENVVGSNFDDTIVGNAGNNTLMGGAGADQLNGDIGNDVLIGGPGIDTLTGDRFGFVGNDTFVLSPNSGIDTITDFQPGHDQIGLSGFSAASFGRDGQLAAGYFDGDHHFHGSGLDGADKLFFQTTTDELFSVDNFIGINGAWTMQGAHEVADINTTLHTSDFAFL